MRTWNSVKMVPWNTPGKSDKTRRIGLTCRFISPVFGGGVDPKKPDPVTPVRVPSIRGQLRFWWRATHADLSLRELRERETRIFGGVHGDEPVASPLVIQVARQPRPPQSLAVFQNGNAFNKAPGITEALAYGAFPLRGLDAAKIHDTLSVYTDSFDLELSFPERDAPEIHRALWAWLHFGGLGGRVRRGFGAIELEKATGWALPSIQEGWPGGQQHPEATWATLGALQDCVVVAKRPYGNGREAQEALLGLMRRMRQGDLGRKPNQPRPGRSYWPEPDAIRNLYRMTGGRHGTPIHNPRIEKFPRARFGAPIIFHFQTPPGEREPPDTTLVPTLRDKKDPLSRLASPLILRPHANGKGGYEALALKLHHRRPDGWALLERNRVKESGLQTKLTPEEAARIIPLSENLSPPQTDAVAAYLARLKTLLPRKIPPCRHIC